MAAIVDETDLWYMRSVNSPHLPNATTFLEARETQQSFHPLVSSKKQPEELYSLRNVK